MRQCMKQKEAAAIALWSQAILIPRIKTAEDPLLRVSLDPGNTRNTYIPRDSNLKAFPLRTIWPASDSAWDLSHTLLSALPPAPRRSSRGLLRRALLFPR